MTEELLRAERTTVGYHGVPALRDFSLSLSAGEMLTLLGPNGAGKTSALLSLVGLLPLMDGQVTALGKPVGKRFPPYALARAGVSLVPDDRGLFPGLTVREHLRLARRRPSKAREEAVFERFAALRSLRNRQVGLLSGGEQQMLAIAKALLAEPKVLMVDEMSLGLAPKVVQEMLPAIRAMARDEQIGVLLVEQHVELALSVADRGIILNHGRTVLAGPAATLLDRRSEVESAYFSSAESVEPHGR
ncbi:amino acid/amide ABC transporter ATP-binding protein 2 (HAAT family) [Tamaricihabitans halophyticus]|uniref:Amino acid/amide ABC transporter ATP-binding protein 2 (HAAT family) n=1 Tax=Tamaricihabitans halophyticus TaxID=1262583 RepID=A0A4R2QMA6_9PSEU|nr:ATP-binding cassette domain-containing protein [Tamaricihabitans halophyticus]TCP49974.1 amino acid/amide ABC transporter ATP-binding protein 2 (HAAT family) [Tamaricihabitans halophyticus]